MRGRVIHAAEQAPPMPGPPGGKTAGLEAPAFKAPPDFRKRFKQRAGTAAMKLNELLFAALDAREDKQGLGQKVILWNSLFR